MCTFKRLVSFFQNNTPIVEIISDLVYENSIINENNNGYTTSQLVDFHEAIKTGNHSLFISILNSVDESYKKQFINDSTLYQSYYGSSLHIAVRHYHDDSCECIRDFTLYPRMCPSKNIITPNRVTIVKELLKYGADPLLVDYYDESALDNSINSNIIFSEPACEVFYFLAKQSLSQIFTNRM